MDKLQQFFVLNIPTSYLKSNNYKINTNLDECRKNNFVISLGDSQLLRTIRNVNQSPFIKEEFEELWGEKKRIKKRKSSKKNIERISFLSKKIDKILFCNDIISVSISHKSHYKYLSQNGFYLNGRKFNEFLAGAGHLRRSTVFFISEGIENKVRNIFENGIDKSIPLNFGKFSAYFGLYASASHEVTTPRIVVIPDLEIKRFRDVDFVDNDNETVYPKTVEVTHNVFDGMGIISMGMAKQWSFDLGLDYDAVQFIVRAPFTKGLLVSFPFDTLARKNGIKTITDIYGNIYNISDIDIILTESQFKMKAHYKSIKEFSENCLNNNLGWGVTRTNPKKEKENFWSSYQFLQVLNKEVNVDELTKNTIKYFSDVSSMDANKTLIYLMGDNNNLDQTKIDNPIVKILAMNKKAIRDPHIIKSVTKTLNRKIKDSYCGKLLLHGHYEFLIADPYALAQWALKIHGDVKDIGLLKEGESYSQYWNNEGVSQIVSGRSPLTWKSELTTLNLKNKEEYKEYFGHLNSGIIINVHGTETMLFADSDFDGDAGFSSDDPQLLEHSMKNGKPIYYDKKVAPKKLLDYKDIWETNIKSFSSKIGLVTNYSSTYYSMESMFGEDTIEYKTIQDRLKICRKLQGDSIDMTKGIEIEKFPEFGRMIKGNEIHNTLLVKKRPLWMIYLYVHKKKEWIHHYSTFDFYCRVVFKKGIDDLLDFEKLSEEQEKVAYKFKKYSPVLIGANGVMDRISMKMLSSISELKVENKNKDFDYRIYQSYGFVPNEEIKNKIKTLIKLYNRMRKDFYLNSAESVENMSSIFSVIRNKIFEISSDQTSLTDNAIDLCYGDMGSNYDFIWNVLLEGMLNNMSKKYGKYKIPVLNKDGDIEFLRNRYSMLEVSIVEGT